MGAALAVVLFIAVIPILVINVKRFTEQEALR
jgi:ABC-type sugar transport system permease subunit